AGCRILDTNTHNQPYIHRSKIGHQHPAHGPIDHIHPFDIPRTYHHVTTIHSRLAKAEEVLWIVAKVCIHLKYIGVMTCQCPTETMYISCSQAQPPGALFDEKTIPKLFYLEFFHLKGGTIRRSIIHDQNMKIYGQRKHSSENSFNIFDFIIGRNDYRSEEHTSELQSRENLVCRLLL